MILDLDTSDGPRRMVFSGDLGSPWSALVESPQPCPEVDAVFVEATYGASRRQEVQADQRRFRQAVGDALRDGKLVWIPAFALDRTRKVLHQIAVGKHEGRIQADVRILVPSPTANQISEQYDSEVSSALRAEVRNFSFGRSGERVGRDLMDCVEGALATDAPTILITTSGMMDTAFSHELLTKLGRSPKVVILEVGYADPLSKAGQIEAGSKSVVTREGARIEVRASTQQFHSFSGHGDGGWVANALPWPSEALRSGPSSSSGSGQGLHSVVWTASGGAVPFDSLATAVTPAGRVGFGEERRASTSAHPRSRLVGAFRPQNPKCRVEP